jgi:hypothetical protein
VHGGQKQAHGGQGRDEQAQGSCCDAGASLGGLDCGGTVEVEGRGRSGHSGGIHGGGRRGACGSLVGCCSGGCEVSGCPSTAAIEVCVVMGWGRSRSNCLVLDNLAFGCRTVGHAGTLAALRDGLFGERSRQAQSRQAQSRQAQSRADQAGASMRSLLHHISSEVCAFYIHDGVGESVKFLLPTFSPIHAFTRSSVSAALSPTLSNMLVARARMLPRLSPLARQATAARRFMADQPNLSPSSSPSTPPPAQPARASVAPVAASPHGTPIPQQRAPRKMQDGYSGVFYITLLAGLVVTAPIITYFYWEHRKVHMRQKKEAILSDIHARVGSPK